MRDAADLGVGHSAETPDFAEELALNDLVVVPPSRTTASSSIGPSLGRRSASSTNSCSSRLLRIRSSSPCASSRSSITGGRTRSKRLAWSLPVVPAKPRRQRNCHFRVPRPRPSARWAMLRTVSVQRVMPLGTATSLATEALVRGNHVATAAAAPHPGNAPSAGATRDPALSSEEGPVAEPGWPRRPAGCHDVGINTLLITWMTPFDAVTSAVVTFAPPT